MKFRKLTVLTVLGVLLLTSVGTNVAQGSIGDRDASRIDSGLHYFHSPMYGYGKTIVKYARQFGINPYVIIGIAGEESTLGKFRCQYNPFGYKFNNGYCVFSSFSEAIYYEAKLLGSKLYKGKSVDEIAQTYCGCDNYQQW
ncbi:MAG: glucosaminidase domain-containing protein, partial [Thaumarchaeota archaeon]|nr:glucosaminidase domain-containing protein [Nitrososphaerota archaeon]